MLSARLLSSSVLQSSATTTCTALAHTDIQLLARHAYRRPKVSVRHKSNKTAQVSAVPQTSLASQFFKQHANFCQMVETAKAQANRSILIDHRGSKYIKLGQLEDVKQVYHIERETFEGPAYMSLIEFKSKESADRAARETGHGKNFFQTDFKILEYQSHSFPRTLDLTYPTQLVQLCDSALDIDRAKTYSELVKSNMMSLIALKLRFIYLVNLEACICGGLFNAYHLMPFGSSVAGIGSNNGDLDIVFTPKLDYPAIIDEFYKSRNLDTTISSICPSPEHPNLIQAGSVRSDPRNEVRMRGFMMFIRELLCKFVPFVRDDSVYSIPHASVPIIQFRYQITDLDSDLSFSLGNHMKDISWLIMTNVIYSLLRANKLFESLVIYARSFGKQNFVTKGSDGGITNFHLTSLVIFYLQQRSLTRDMKLVNANVGARSIIESFSQIFTKKTPQTIDISDSDLEELLPTLILDFFTYYSEFDFNTLQFELYTGKAVRKGSNSPLVAINPLDMSRNMCRSVRTKALASFIKSCRSARAKIESGQSSPLTLLYKGLDGKQASLHKRVRNLNLTAHDIIYASSSVTQDH